MTLTHLDYRRANLRLLGRLVGVLIPATLVGQAPPPEESYITILPGQNIQGFVNLAPEGAAFLLAAGVHRMQTISPKNNQVFVGEPGAILSGALVLTSLSPSGGAWVASAQTQEGAPRGSVGDGVFGGAL